MGSKKLAVTKVQKIEDFKFLSRKNKKFRSGVFENLKF